MNLQAAKEVLATTYQEYGWTAKLWEGKRLYINRGREWKFWIDCQTGEVTHEYASPRKSMVEMAEAVKAAFFSSDEKGVEGPYKSDYSNIMHWFENENG